MYSKPRELRSLELDPIQLYRIFTEMDGFYYRARRLQLKEEKLNNGQDGSAGHSTEVPRIPEN
jgi:hypothetical protein